MSQYLSIRRVGAVQAGWYQEVETVPQVGALLICGCAHGEEQNTVEGNRLTDEALWRVEAVIHRFLCPTEAQTDPRAAVTVEVVVSPATTHDRALVARTKDLA